MSGDDFYEFCAANPDVDMELTAKGEIVIGPPAGYASDSYSNEIAACIRGWVKSTGRGRASGSSAGFILPSGRVLSPDAAWVSSERMAGFSREQRKKFLRVVPNFVVEVLSPSDFLSSARAKMQTWISEGVELAWLIDVDNETIYIYRTGQAKPEVILGPKTASGENVLEGFVVELEPIWGDL
jgi:Uma2 family endonuclease